MSADDQAFLDVLSSVPNDIWRYSHNIADYVDGELDKVSNILREAREAVSSSWIPESARRRSPPPSTFIESVASSNSTFSKVHDWVLKNKILTTVIVIAIGGLTYHVIRRKSNRKKRRAKKAGNGARLEVVVVAGSPSEAITRSISLDLERRGFIVYVVCNSIEEELIVQNESRPDIKPLMLDIVDPGSARASIDRFTAHLQSPHAAFQGARPHHLTFRSLLLIPSINYPSQPIATLSPSTLSDLLNTRLLKPILTVQTFLPLLTSLPLHPQIHHPPSPAKPSVLVLTPSIIPSLNPAFHLPESSICAALSSFTSVLEAELAPLNIPVSHLQLGTFDLSSFSPHHRQLTTQAQRAETLRWEDSARLAYGRNFVSTSTGLGRGPGRGSSLRELHDAVFDAMVSGKGRVVRVGMGSSVYGFVGRWVPKGLVGWMMGVKKVGGKEQAKEFGKGMELVLGEGSRATSPGSSGGGSARGLAESEYVSVYGNRSSSEGGIEDVDPERANGFGSPGHVWKVDE